MRLLHRSLGFAALLSILGTDSLYAHGVRIPAFARKYGLSCSVCHSPAPRLTKFGEEFAGRGFVVAEGEEPRDTINTGDPMLRLQRNLPLAIRLDAYLRAQNESSRGDRSIDLQTPWVMKLLSGGQVADNVSYYLYFLLTERGEVAGLEDAYLQFNDVAGSGVNVILGQFQVSDPLFKRELRLQYEDYQPYRVRVGESPVDLTYDRGLMALASPWTGGDLAVQLVSGVGLGQAGDNRQFDRDNGKSGMVRFSQDVGPLRLGAFGYLGTERRDGIQNRVAMWGPDATLPLGSIGELNLQYYRRTDDDPFYGSCSPTQPCPGGATRPFATTVDAGFAEAVLWPGGAGGRLFFTTLFNWIDSDDPVVSLRLGEQSETPGFLSRYRSASGGVHYLMRRNVRLMTELGWDFEREQARIIAGTIVAF